MTIGMALLFSQKSLKQRRNWMAPTYLCSVRSCLLESRPCCFVLPNATKPGPEMPSQSCLKPRPGVSMTQQVSSSRPATGVKLLTAFCQGPSASTRLLSVPQSGRRQPAALALKYLTLEVWNPLLLSQPSLTLALSDNVSR